MKPTSSETSSATSSRSLVRTEQWHVVRVFSAWCLRREAPTWPPSLYRLAVLIPIVVAVGFETVLWPHLRYPGAGGVAMRQLLGMAAMVVLIGGVQYASKAVCWELSAEMRDVVRVTGLDPKLLLWSRTLSRWWTIGWSVLLMLPLALTSGDRVELLSAGAYVTTYASQRFNGFAPLAEHYL